MRVLLFTVILFFSVNLVKSQNPYVPVESDPLLEPWRWKHFPKLSNIGFQAFVEDDNSIIWFAVTGGLISFDGYTWEEHNYSSGVRGGGSLFKLLSFKDGIYLVFRNNLLAYKNNKWSVLFELPPQTRGIMFQDILFQPETDNMYVAGQGCLIYSTDEQQFVYTFENRKDQLDTIFKDANIKIIPKNSGIKERASFRQLVFNAEGDLYVLGQNLGDNGTLCIKQSGDKNNPLTFEQLPNIGGQCVIRYNPSTALVKGNEIWTVSRLTGTGLSILKDNKWKNISVSAIFGDRDIYCDIVDLGNNSVILGSEGQLYIQRNNKWNRYQYPQIPATSSGYIRVLKTRDGNLWVGGVDNDVFHVEYSDKQWQTYQNLFFQFEDENSRWFFSSDNKVVFQDSTGWYSYDQTNGLIDAPNKLFKAKGNIIWCTGSEKGSSALSYLHNNKWNKIVLDSMALTVESRSIFVDSDSSFYFSAKVGTRKTSPGIYRISYESIDDISVYRIPGVNTTGATGGITRFKDGRLYYSFLTNVHSIDKNDSVTTKQIAQGKHSALARTPDGNIWFGTESKGIYLYDGENAVKTDITNGLVSNIITNICPDGDSTVWVATEKDITRFDGNTWINNVFDNRFIVEKEAGDIKTDNHGGIWINIVPKKWILQGLNPGINYDFSEGFYSVRYVPDEKPPKCQFEFYTSQIDPAGNSHITWSGVDYLNETASDKLMFSYKLDEKNWTPYTLGNSKTFLSLSTGKHTLQLRAKDKIGNTSILSDIIRFRVQPPVYMRAWFLSMVGFFIAVIVFLIRRIVIKNKKLISNNYELQEKQEEIIAQNEEISQQAEELAAQRDSLEEQNEEIKSKNEQISQAFKRIEMLSEFGQKLTASLSIHSINDMLYNYVSKIIDIHAFGIGIYREETKQIIFPKFYEKGTDPTYVSKDVSQTTGLTAWCFNHQKPVLINDIERENERYMGKKLDVKDSSKIANSRIHLPLTVNEKKIGIFVVNSFDKNAYSDDDFTNLITLASYISIALDNANAYEQINDKNRAIRESINYAKSIQSAFMPTQEQLDRYLDCFVLFKPKDVVSGDFTWFSPLEKDETKPLKAFICTADCTGHGVPGALVSMVGNNLLDKYINTLHDTNPAQILEKVNVGFQLALKQDETRNNDGMDMALVYIEEQNDKSIKLIFSGAKNPCIIYKADSKSMKVLKGSRKSIGGLRAKRSKQFYENNETVLSKGDMVYLITDGIIDQHNVQRNRFTKERLISLLKKNAVKKCASQKEILETALQEHMNGEKQTDDISVIGIRI